MRNGHSMPFGAEPGSDGVRFRLWAPAAERVELLIEGAAARAMPMEAVGGGWFECVAGSAAAGSLYRFRVDGDATVPDPASRYQPGDVHGASAVVDPDSFPWTQDGWRGRPWHEAVLYELHVGAFSPEGNYDGVVRRLDHLVDLGVTAIELMPLGDFAGRRNWGYDGVLLYAPDSSYGTPDDLKRLIDAAHRRGLMVLLDVVYNHFGPDGNFLQRYAPQFFTDRFHTPWGAAIDYSRPEVRGFFIHNALYWLEEYRFDGLRLDAVHAIDDPSTPDILEELAGAVNRRFAGRRQVHLVLENDDNAARYLVRGADGLPRHYVAQWNDDIHHALHVIATGEDAAYYADYADRPLEHLARCLAEGFAFQGDPSPHRGGRLRGSASSGLPPAAFVSFLQNHDQIGNRAFGERLVTLCAPRVLKVLLAIVLLAPQPPLLFMGEEWGAPEPFLFFCDFHDALADAVREGRRKEFAHFPEFRDAAARAKIPDPNAEATFRRSTLEWERSQSADHAAWLAYYRELLALRRREIVPRLANATGGGGMSQRFGAGGLCALWRLGDRSELMLLANLSPSATGHVPTAPAGRLLYATDEAAGGAIAHGTMPPWCVAWFAN